MGSRYQNFIVGIFVFVGLIVLGGLIVIFGGGKTLLVKTYDLRVLFPGGVAGVQSGQTVTLNGKRIGETRDLAFADPVHLERGVKVLVAIEGFSLPAASEMIVSPPAMGLGKPLIELQVLDPTDTRKLPRDGTAQINGQMRSAMDQLVPKNMQKSFLDASTHIGELAAALTPVANNLSRLLEQRDVKEVDLKGITANMATLIQRFDATLKSLNELIGSEANQRNFSEVLANAKKISETGVTAMQNVTDLSGQGKDLMKNLTELMQHMIGLSDNLSGVLKRMDTVVLSMNKKEGTIGLMLNDGRLYEEMLLTMRRLTKLLDDFREVADQAKKGQLRIRAF
jgi:phospholipid/cholesterol/gamma-HCH transport system substrate-binding protein